MRFVAVLFGAILLALGVFGYVGSDSRDAELNDDQATSEAASANSAEERASATQSKRSMTALIPAVFGALLLMCGLAAIKPGWNRHAMHVAAGIALIGAVAAGGRGAMKIGPLLRGDSEVNRRATIFVLLMAIICLVYLFLSVRSFIAARRANSRQPANTTDVD